MLGKPEWLHLCPILARLSPFPSSGSVASLLLFLALHWTTSDGQLLVFGLVKKKDSTALIHSGVIAQGTDFKIQCSWIRLPLSSGLRQRSPKWLRVGFSLPHRHQCKFHITGCSSCLLLPRTGSCFLLIISVDGFYNPLWLWSRQKQKLESARHGFQSLLGS